MKKLFIIFAILFCGIAHSAQIVNVEYIHNAIRQKWDITIPYNSELTNPRVAANMKYLLTAVDVANEMLNGDKTTDYGGGEYATTVAADTVATDLAVESLVKSQTTSGFVVTVEGSYIEFSISAAGTFHIDWGDKTAETITKNHAEETTVSHSYNTFGKYKIKLDGNATAYDTDSWSTPTISFNPYLYFSDASVIAIDGSLSKIFPTLPDGTNPRFYQSFLGTSIKSIPNDLFSGLHGQWSEMMFYGTFAETNIQEIPPNLFADLSGPGTSQLFYNSFQGTKITEIPENLFSGCESLSSSIFAGTFADTNITEIPENLFSSFRHSGNAPLYTFSYTFSGTPITSIPENLFKSIPAGGAAFDGTFAGTNITKIPENLFANILFNGDLFALFASTFENTPITSIPENLFTHVLNNADIMDYSEAFWSTFYGCSQLSELPNNLFAGINLNNSIYSSSIFAYTFADCVNLQTIPDNLLGASEINTEVFDNNYTMFMGMFAGCNSLTGPSVRINGQYLYEIQPNDFNDNFIGMYYVATGLTDYNNIPEGWK